MFKKRGIVGYGSQIALTSLDPQTKHLEAGEDI